MASVATKLMTADEFYEWTHRAENRDRHFELEQGKVVERSRPGEKHGVVCHNVNYLFGGYLRQRRRGRVCANDTGLILQRNPDTVRGPVKFDKYGNVVGNVYIRKVERKDKRLVNTVIKTYPNVRQFWTYNPEEFLKNPVYSRDWPPAKNLEQ